MAKTVDASFAELLHEMRKNEAQAIDVTLRLSKRYSKRRKSRKRKMAK